MAESDRITALETKVESLETRISKLESSDESRVLSFASIDTKIQLLGQKFDVFVESLEKADNNKKFNWSQVLVGLGIILALGTTIWATNYTVKQTLQTSNNTLAINQEDLNVLTQTILNKIQEDSRY